MWLWFLKLIWFFMPKRLPEIEIKNFRGIERNSTPHKDACIICDNLDLRADVDGELEVTRGITTVYAPPTLASFTYNGAGQGVLGFERIYMSQFATPQEVTLMVIKGTLARVGTTASIASKNILAFCIRPHYNSGAWSDTWLWLNQMMISHLTAVSSYSVTVNGLQLGQFKVPTGIIYNVTRNEYANMLSVADSGVPIDITNNASTWQVNDTVILMDEYIPLTYLEGMYSATAAQINFHKVLNDIRVGTGGYANRLGVGVGYRKKDFYIESAEAPTPPFSGVSLDRVILDPYNIITDSGTYNFTITATGSSPDAGFLHAKHGKAIFYKITALLDGFNEYVIEEGSKEYSNGNSLITFKPSIRMATMNKRITAFNLYIAIGDPNDASIRAGNFYFIRSYSLVSEPEPEAGFDIFWHVDEDGYLKYGTTTVGFAERGFVVTASMVDSATLEIEEQLGYFPTTDLVKSWDQAVEAGGSIHYLNPYINERNTNKIIVSVISGDGAFQQDVAPPTNYHDLGSRDGNDVVALEVMPNENLLAIRQNSRQEVNTLTGRVVDLDVGGGAVSRKSIVNFGKHIAIPDKDDVLIYGWGRDENISEATIRDLYRSISDKTAIFAAKDDKGDAYVMNAGGGDYEYVFVNGKGWTRNFPYGGTGRPIAYTNSNDGYLYYLGDDGSVYRRDNTIPTTVFDWKSIVFDVSKMDEFSSRDRLYPHSFWIEYAADNDFGFDVFGDGVSLYGASGEITSPYEGLKIPAASTYNQRKFPPRFSRACKTLQLRVFGSTASDDTTKFRLKAVGLKFAVIKAGRFAR
jgi:hypothetical protein